MANRLSGKETPAPPFPLRDLGLSREEAAKVRDRPGADEWWDATFHLGRVPFDSKYCAVWRALFESFAPVERASAPVCRFPHSLEESPFAWRNPAESQGRAPGGV